MIAFDQQLIRLLRQRRYFHLHWLTQCTTLSFSADVSCPEDVDRDECFLQSFKNAEHYRSMDLSVITGAVLCLPEVFVFQDIGS